MKKRNVELVMALLFIISCVSLMLNIIDRNKMENDDNYVQTTLYSDEDNLYSEHQYIENDLFEKYFVVKIGKRVKYLQYMQEPGVIDSSSNKLKDEYVREEMVVNKIKYSSSYNGETASDGKEYITINITNYNLESYGRLIKLGTNLSYNTNLENYKDEQEELYRNAIYDYPEGTPTYTLKYDDTLNTMAYVKTISDATNIFYIEPNSSVTYNVTYEIDKGQRNGLALRCYNNRRLRSNSDYIILLY